MTTREYFRQLRREMWTAQTLPCGRIDTIARLICEQTTTPRRFLHAMGDRPSPAEMTELAAEYATYCAQATALPEQVEDALAEVGCALPESRAFRAYAELLRKRIFWQQLID